MGRVLGRFVGESDLWGDFCATWPLLLFIVLDGFSRNFILECIFLLDYLGTAYYVFIIVFSMVTCRLCELDECCLG